MVKLLLNVYLMYLSASLYLCQIVIMYSYTPETKINIMGSVASELKHKTVVMNSGNNLGQH